MIDSKLLTKKLYYSDNLPVLLEMDGESVDLIYLDPPFNSNRAYNIIWSDDLGQTTAFEDTWSWSPECDVQLRDIEHLEARSILNALVDAMGKVQLCAYLVNMAVRLIEMKRILKPNGSIYLHCDPTASHYLKIIMDAIFGSKNFQNEIIWCYNVGGKSRKRWARKHDVILFYSKSDKFKFYGNAVGIPRDTGTKSFGGKIGFDEKGRHYQDKIVKNTGKIYRYYLDKPKIPEDWWADINSLQSGSKERLGYPTQKPLELLERIVKASSKEGDIVLDPFCGCGTTIAAAEKLKRHWIGIDITYSSIAAIQERFRRQKINIWGDIQVLGKPETIEEVETNLINKSSARTRKEFEKFCVTSIGGLPNDKMGADDGIDGRIRLTDKEVAIVSVKSGKVTLDQIRALKGLLNGNNKIGIFITKNKPTKGMVKFANQSGVYKPDETFVLARATYVPKIQILTLEQILRGEQPVLS